MVKVTFCSPWLIMVYKRLKLCSELGLCWTMPNVKISDKYDVKFQFRDPMSRHPQLIVYTDRHIEPHQGELYYSDKEF